MVSSINPRNFRIDLGLSPGFYQYKYVVDGEWKCDPSEPIVEDGLGGHNNIIEIKPLNTNDEEEPEDNYFIFIQSPDHQGKVKSKKIVY